MSDALRLYHYTCGPNLRGIAKHGLTVGDVPTDIQRNAGRIGVWLTSEAGSSGHGLPTHKERFRVEVSGLQSGPNLVRWNDWASLNVTPSTIEALTNADGAAADTWWIYFGQIKPEMLSSVVDMETGTAVEHWQSVWPEQDSRPGIPFWNRSAWHRKTLKQVVRVLSKQAEARNAARQ